MGYRVHDLCFMFWVLGFGIRVSVFGIRDSGLECTFAGRARDALARRGVRDPKVEPRDRERHRPWRGGWGVSTHARHSPASVTDREPTLPIFHPRRPLPPVANWERLPPLLQGVEVSHPNARGTCTPGPTLNANPPNQEPGPPQTMNTNPPHHEPNPPNLNPRS